MDADRILVVDDDRNITRMMNIGLAQKGCIVETENEPRAAAEAARCFMPDLIFLDIEMPGMDGGDVAREIRKTPETADIPIIFLSSLVQRSEVEDAGGMIGGDEFIAKPVDLERIERRINQRLHKNTAV